MNIKLTRLNGGLHLDIAPPYITNYLQYHHRVMTTKNWKRETVFEKRLLHTADGNGGVFTLQGFYVSLCDLIHKNHDTFTVVDTRTKLPEINWDEIKRIGPRDYQIDAVVDFLLRGSEDSGIINATGGYGKTYCQALTYAAWHELNTILAIPLNQVFRQTYKKFVELFPDKHIGRVGDGFFDISEDLTITTFRSLDKCAIEKCELLLIDELQSATGDLIQSVLSKFAPRRIFGYTATDDGLFNNADKLIKGIFGERLIYIPYDEALEVGAVVPGTVYFVRVNAPEQFSRTFESALTEGIKKCRRRNELIAEACAAVPAGWATLVFVDHVHDHLINLYKLMPPGTKYIHRNSNKKEIGAYALSKKQQDAVIEEFSSNQFQYLIATDAFRAGVDIPHLRVVIQGSGGASKVEVLQEALRGSRILTEERREELGLPEKTHFVVIDFLDNHDERLTALSNKRRAYYKEQGWVIRDVNSIEEIDWNYYETSNFRQSGTARTGPEAQSEFVSSGNPNTVNCS